MAQENGNVVLKKIFKLIESLDFYSGDRNTVLKQYKMQLIIVWY